MCASGFCYSNNNNCLYYYYYYYYIKILVKISKTLLQVARHWTVKQPGLYFTNQKHRKISTFGFAFYPFNICAKWMNKWIRLKRNWSIAIAIAIAWALMYWSRFLVRILLWVCSVFNTYLFKQRLYAYPSPMNQAQLILIEFVILVSLKDLVINWPSHDTQQ